MENRCFTGYSDDNNYVFYFQCNMMITLMVMKMVSNGSYI